MSELYSPEKKEEEPPTNNQEKKEEGNKKEKQIPGLVTPELSRNQRKKARRKEAAPKNSKEKNKMTANDFKLEKPKIKPLSPNPSFSDYEFDEESDSDDNDEAKSKFFKAPSPGVNTIVDNIEKAIAQKRGLSSPEEIARRMRTKGDPASAGSLAM